MGQLPRVNNKGNFRTGFKPTEQNFEDVFDSMISIQDDHVEPFVVGVETYLRIGVGGTNTPTPPLPRLEVNGGIRLGSLAPLTGPNLEGTLIYDGTQLMVHNGAQFNPVGGGGGTVAGLDITSNAGNIDFNANTVGAELSFSSGGLPAFTVTGGGQVQMDALQVTTAMTLPNGNVVTAGTASFVPGGSDERLKQNIRPFEDGLALLKQVNPVHFQFKEGIFGGPKEDHVGVIAQQIQGLFPYLVKEESTEGHGFDTENGKYLTFNPGPLTYILINAVKTLSEQVETLQAKLALLEKDIQLMPAND